MGKEVVDVLIMTPLPEEMAAVVAVLGPTHATGTKPIAHRVWERVDLGHARRGRVVAFLPSDTDQVNAARGVRLALERWNPRCVALVGIAGGLTDKAHLGSVVVGRYVWHYDAKRKVQARVDEADVVSWAPVPLDIGSFGVARAQLVLSGSAYYEWVNRCLEQAKTLFNESIPEGVFLNSPELFVEDIATGSAVVDSPSERDKIAGLSRKLFAVETEAAGFLSALDGNQAIVLRGSRTLHQARGPPMRSKAELGGATRPKTQHGC